MNLGRILFKLQKIFAIVVILIVLFIELGSYVNPIALKLDFVVKDECELLILLPLYPMYL